MSACRPGRAQRAHGPGMLALLHHPGEHGDILFLVVGAMLCCAEGCGALVDERSGHRKVTALCCWVCRNLENDALSPGVVSRVGAASPVECLSSYSQIVDGNYFLPVSSDEGVTKRSGVRSFSACVDLCSAMKCQIVTYDYATRECFLRVSQTPVLEG